MERYPRAPLFYLMIVLCLSILAPGGCFGSREPVILSCSNDCICKGGVVPSPSCQCPASPTGVVCGGVFFGCALLPNCPTCCSALTLACDEVCESCTPGTCTSLFLGCLGTCSESEGRGSA